jgi:hypothetical protein
MIYLMGMSHMQAIVQAYAKEFVAQNRIMVPPAAPAFVDFDAAPGMSRDRIKVASLYVGHLPPEWGAVLATEPQPGVLAYSPGYHTLLKSMEPAADATLFVFMNGEEHIRMMRRQHAVPYDFFMPSRPDLPALPGRQILPLEVIVHQVAQQTADAVASLSTIRMVHPALRIVNVLCPPPVPDNKLDILDARSQGNTWTDDTFRLKYYLLYAEYLTRMAAQRGIVTLHPAPETIGPDGLLLPEFVEDAVHGNAAYGERMIRLMEQIHSRAMA